MAFNEESTVAVSACQDGVVRCFDVRDKNAPIQVILYFPSLCSFFFPFSIIHVNSKVYFINQHLILQQMDEAKDAVLTVDVNSHEIASGSADGSARIYSIRDGKLTDGNLVYELVVQKVYSLRQNQ